LKVDRVDKGPSDLSKKVTETPLASSIGVTGILEVMIRPLPFRMLSPLGSDLTSILMKDKNAEGGTSRIPIEETTKSPAEEIPKNPELGGLGSLF
jgi:hypothetical protein